MDTTLIDNYINGNLKLHRAELACAGTQSSELRKEAERNIIMECRLLIEKKRSTDPEFKGLNAEKWQKLLIKKGITESRAQILVKALSKDLEVIA